MKDLGQLQRVLKQAKEMQERLHQELEEMRIEGSSGGGMVTVTLDGHKTMTTVRLDPEVVNKEDVEMLQDLILAAVRDATSKVDEMISEKLGSLGAGLKIPGLV